MLLKPKNFIQWTNLKAIVHNNFLNRPLYIHYKEGSIYHTYVGQNIGYEQDGKGWFFERPVLVVAGITQDLFWGVPLTTKNNMGRYYHRLTTANYSEPIISVAILSQLRVFDVARIQHRKPMGAIELSELRDIQTKLANILRKNLSPTLKGGSSPILSRNSLPTAMDSEN